MTGDDFPIWNWIMWALGIGAAIGAAMVGLIVFLARVFR